jgi:BirA family biotin operon repressor/biotin-[acetyl-CoA-carboxylase] ligase
MSTERPLKLIGQTLLHHEQVVSTNDLAKQHAREGAAEGLVIFADEQTGGRGRLGRTWTAPPKSSLLLSVLLRPIWLPLPDAFMLTMMAGIALCKAVEQIVPIQAGLKWPNDLWLPSSPSSIKPACKAAGILSELEISRHQLSWVVIGIGVNVDWQPTGIVDGRDLSQSATSLTCSSGQAVDRQELLFALLEQIEQGYLKLRKGFHEEVFQEWRGRLAMLGHEVEIRTATEIIRGIAEDVDQTGALLVRDMDGVLHTILSGDVM